MDPEVPCTELEGAITVTPAEIIYHRRLAVLDHAARCGNVSEACRTFGVSRTRYYEWKNLAVRYGPEALVPKARRRPQLPNATPTHVVEQLLTLAVLEPTLGRPPPGRPARRYGLAGGCFHGPEICWVFCWVFEDKATIRL
jgi:hypothetical protein